MIRKCEAEDIQRVCFIINEAARAFNGIIPSDCYHQPYMPLDELKNEMRRVTFFGWEINRGLIGVMGFEAINGVTLIRHAYVLSQFQKCSIGSELLNYLINMASTARLLVGTWADAKWAIDFYRKHEFNLLGDKNDLLKTYWNIPHRQIETSVVMGLDPGKGKRSRNEKELVTQIGRDRHGRGHDDSNFQGT